MRNKTDFNLEYSYLSLPNKFYSLVKPMPVAKPELFLLNHELCNELNISTKDPESIINAIYGNDPDNSKTFSQAYAGHQFGHFTMLGDGRAVVVGEHITDGGNRFDMQLKGSGKTPYSRAGDGKATLKSMLREYLLSEAIHHLNIPTSRSLAVLKTGEVVRRETLNEGAVLIRVMKSHIRIGTFEYARHFGTTDDLKALLQYTIKRLLPDVEQSENQALSLLKKVISLQIELVVNWMRVGFIHGVMNTDNVSISGETFDFGPCAFLNSHHPETVYSSIDAYGRYSFGNQPEIMKWNIARLAEALLPLIHNDSETSLMLAQNAIDEFDEIWNEKYYSTMLNKLGIENKNKDFYPLVDELLELMTNLKLDYTNTFYALGTDVNSKDNPKQRPELKTWLEKWQNAIFKNSNGSETSRELMSLNNPVYIPRNHLVEQALNEAVEGNMTLFDRLLGVLKTPYTYQKNCDSFTKQPDTDFEMRYQTFCGT
ncbi:protein adenylyltransferase SelO [Alkalitalea saponilacus]|uniref:Protein nucleotidyltransferase YdiU n=1 Tax=Alkalitalea saponilacus TaxID=889453 RepID=A0A1T5DZA5_9BACT|nr:YdiU family protein [Alkalitalea saponilacus]ASB49146.1 hypothetical protein CDL62_08325 [Alkalitalea saponilacus]SKB76909.1 Uncharacterized conserved protein YdiU, UPF0061 family [Alkalitalea saponilacus]